MNSFSKSLFVCLAILCALVLLNPTAFAAKASFEEAGDAIPPYGETGDPGGTKLTGVMYIRYFDYHQDLETGTYLAEGATFAIRLQREKSTIPTVFYGEYEGELDFGDPASILDKLYEVLEVAVEGRFFPGEDMVFKIKTLKNEGIAEIGDSAPIDLIVLVDVDVSAKPAE